MKKANRTLLFGIIVVPLLLGVPAWLDLFYPYRFAAFYELSYVFWFFTLAYFLIGPNHIAHFESAPEPCRYLGWIFQIFSIQVAFLIIFLSQLLTLYQYQNAIAVTPSVVDHIIRNLAYLPFKNSGIFPWTLLSSGLIFFFFASQRNSVHGFSALMPFRKTVIGRLFSRVVDGYFIYAIRIFYAMTVAFLGIQLSFLAFPLFSTLFVPMLGVATAAFLLMIAYLKPVEEIFHRLRKKSSVMVFFLLQVIAIAVVFSVFSAVIQHLNFKTSVSIITLVPTKWLPSLYQVWFFSWWLIVTPFMSSLIFYFSRGKSLKLIMFASLLLPIIMWLLPYSWIELIINNVIKTNDAVYFLQALSLLVILLFLKHKQSRSALWLGFIPGKMMNKVRFLDVKAMWALPPALLALLALSGIQGLQLVMCFCSFGLLLIYFSYMIFIWRFKE